MWIFNERADLQKFIDVAGEGVVSIYLDDGLDQRGLQMIHEAKAAFDKLVGPDWHLLIPHESGGLTVNFRGERNGFNHELSMSLAEEFEVPLGGLPALVFPSPDQTEAVLTLKLGHLTAEQRIRLIRTIAEIVTRPRERSYNDPEAFRSEVVEEIRYAQIGEGAAKIGYAIMSNATKIARTILS